VTLSSLRHQNVTKITSQNFSIWAPLHSKFLATPVAWPKDSKVTLQFSSQASILSL